MPGKQRLCDLIQLCVFFRQALFLTLCLCASVVNQALLLAQYLQIPRHRFDAAIEIR